VDDGGSEAVIKAELIAAMKRIAEILNAGKTIRWDEATNDIIEVAIKHR
jgi:hypothetical protein